MNRDKIGALERAIDNVIATAGDGYSDTAVMALAVAAADYCGMWCERFHDPGEARGLLSDEEAVLGCRRGLRGGVEFETARFDWLTGTFRRGSHEAPLAAWLKLPASEAKELIRGSGK